jgi:RND family efflux transporter MFP subunit
MKRSILISILVLVLVVLVTGCNKGKEDKTTLEKKPIKVKIEKVRKGEFIKVINYKGTVLPWKQANIGPDVSGRIAKIFKKQGDEVKKGTLLAELDTTNMELQKKQVEAALEVAKASYKDAKLNFERMKKLYDKNAVSQMQYEKAQLVLEVGDTQKKSAEANLDVIKHTLNNSYMRAPFDGIITSKNHDEGDIVNPMMGMAAGVLTLMDLNQVKINIDVPAEDIEKIKINQVCHVQINSLPGEIFQGKVYSKNLAADPLSKTFKVEILIDNPEIKIKAGVFAEVDIEILKQENSLLLPYSAVIEEKYVVLFNNGTAKFVDVKIGGKNGRFYEIAAGLSEGESVVVEGNYDLKEGSLISEKEVE